MANVTATTTTVLTTTINNGLVTLNQNSLQTFITGNALEAATTTPTYQKNFLFDSMADYFNNMLVLGQTILWPLFGLIYGGSLLAFIIGRSILFYKQARRQRDFCEKLRKKRLEQCLKEEAEEAERFLREADEKDPEPDDEIEKIAWWKRRLGRPMRHHVRGYIRDVQPDWPYQRGYQVPYRWDYVNDPEDDEEETPVTAVQVTSNDALPGPSNRYEPPAPQEPEPIIVPPKPEPPRPMVFKPMNVIGEEPAFKPLPPVQQQTTLPAVKPQFVKPSSPPPVVFKPTAVAPIVVARPLQPQPEPVRPMPVIKPPPPPPAKKKAGDSDDDDDDDDDDDGMFVMDLGFAGASGAPARTSSVGSRPKSPHAPSPPPPPVNDDRNKKPVVKHQDGDDDDDDDEPRYQRREDYY